MTERRRFLALVAVAFALAAVPAGVGTYAELTDRECVAVAFDASGGAAPSTPACDGWDESAGTESGATKLAADDTTTPTITNYRVTTNGDGTEAPTVMAIFDSSEPLDTVELVVERDGEQVTTLRLDPETGEGRVMSADGTTYTGYYTASVSPGESAEFTLVLRTAADAAGNDGATGQTGTVTASGPNGSGDDSTDGTGG